MSQVSITYKDLLSNEDAITKWISIYRLLNIDDKNTDCPITLDKINIMDKYCKCSKCNYNFKYDPLLKHLDIRYDCPMCRCIWINHEIYINGEKIIKKDLYMFNNLSNKIVKNKIKIDFT